MRERARRLAAPALDVVRARGRHVAWTPPWMGFGNHALAWFWAWRGRTRGERRLVLRTEAMLPWLQAFPEGLDLTVARRDVRFTDRRTMPWHIASDDGAPPFTPDWAPGELTAFVDEVLLSSRTFREALATRAPSPGTVVVNVRRGDYYDEEHVGTWGFDVEGYLRHVLPGVVAAAPADRLHVVTDGAAWCREHLAWAADLAPLTFAEPADGPVEHLATVAGAQRLVVTNSTFSYWGGYLGDVLHGDAHEVHAPRFFNRTQNEGRSWLLDPRWHVTEDLPGGWAP